MATHQLTTHITRRQLAGLTVQETIQALTGHSEEEYTWAKYLAGRAYLNGTIDAMEGLRNDYRTEAKKYLESSKEFWAWWKNQWLLRDENSLPWLLDQSAGGRSPEWFAKAYAGLHNVEDMVCDLPEFEALNRSFRISILPLTDRV